MIHKTQFKYGHYFFILASKTIRLLLDVRRQAIALIGIGQVHLILQGINTAKECFNDALNLVQETEHVEIIKDARKGLSYVQHILQTQQ